ncbi:MAG TPA: ABC transporter ATP-binding protein [Candidatus Sulfotelmatobacter sp.]|nr:ABC transporter ATP-binding protein [Candidatus Sulfotelmatobacter sp.]
MTALSNHYGLQHQSSTAVEPGQRPHRSGDGTVAPVPVIAIRGLTKRYGPLTALNDLNLEIQRGETFGFLGLNGAGKTTTIRLLLDLLRPTSGQACIFGYNCWAEGLAARARIGYLPGELGFYLDLTGLETLDFLAGLNQQAADKRYRQELCDRLEMPQRDLRRRLREYSAGMKRKLGIIQAFQAHPPLLILDEPTDGLDPLMQEAFYALLVDAKRRGATVFMSSHVLSEVERVCDRIALLRKGELVLLCSVRESRRLAPRRVRVFFSEDVSIDPQLPPGQELVESAPRHWRLTVAGPLGPLLAALEGLPVQDLEVEEARLEEVVLKYYRQEAP